MIFHSGPFSEKTNGNLKKKKKKKSRTPFLGNFGSFLCKNSQMEVFPKNRASPVFIYYNYVKTCQKLEKTKDASNLRTYG